MNPIPDLEKLLNEGEPLRITNYPKKYPANIGLQYAKLSDIKRVLLGKGHDPININHFITPADQFFIRNHSQVPAIDLNSWTLRLEGCFQNKTVLSMSDIKRYKSITRVVCFECTGNQRNEKFTYGKQTTAFLKQSSFNKLMRLIDPVQFPMTIQLIIRIIKGFGITGGNFFDNGVFTGVKLFDILKDYPFRQDAEEIVFEGIDKGYDMLTQRVSRKKVNYARSFKVAELKNYEPMLCYEMNGIPLSSDHGGPLRLIIPGVYGAEHVKWLGGLIAIPDRFDGYYQNEYYGYKVDGEMVPVHEQRPKSMVIKVLKRDEKITAYGVAWRGLSSINKVEVSIDDTQTWQPAEHLCDEIEYSWFFWQYQLPPGLKGHIKIIPRAFTENGNCQPLEPGEYSTIYGNNSVISAVVNI